MSICIEVSILHIVPCICVSDSGQHWFRYSAPSHYLNQCWIIVIWTLRNKLKWHFNQNIVCEMVAILSMGLLPDTQICGCACAGNAGNVFPVTAGKRSRHASRHVRHARAVMHVGIANQRFPLKSAAGENVPGIPGACATCNFPYLVRGPWGDELRTIYI